LTPLRATTLWGPVAAWMTAIFTASSRSDVGGLGQVPDWLTHGLAYLGLAVLVCRALAGGLRPLSAGGALLSAVLCSGYGILDEVHQSFVPGRDSSAADVGKDVGGSVLGAILFQRALGSRVRQARSAALKAGSPAAKIEP
jgi:hypothetical protein